MLSYEKVKKHPKRFRACTSLDVAEFKLVFRTSLHI